MVNIAIFAAFWHCVKGILLADAEFKPCGAMRQRDVSRSGRQKRQDRGKNGKVRGTVSTDSGTLWRVQGAVAQGGWVGMSGFRLAMRLFRCLRSQVVPR
jgi:hypothetical protein